MKFCLHLKQFNYLGSNMLPAGSDSKEYTCSAGNPSSIPGSRRSPRQGNGYPCQASFLENAMEGEAWQATVHGVTKSQT